MQALGGRGRYIKVKAPGKNALDFHLSFHLGELTNQEPDCTYWIISKDSGYDPLIEHLQARGLAVERVMWPTPAMVAKPPFLPCLNRQGLEPEVVVGREECSECPLKDPALQIEETCLHHYRESDLIPGTQHPIYHPGASIVKGCR
jgi:hypothetical protein